MNVACIFFLFINMMYFTSFKSILLQPTYCMFEHNLVTFNELGLTAEFKQTKLLHMLVIICFVL